MGVFDWKFLNSAQLRGFDTYKYSCVDNSPISVYISHPFWNWFVNFYPRWLAPNVLTLAGASLIMASYGLVSFLDPELKANSVESPASGNLPEWLWLVCSVCTFFAHLLDGTDGKQARRVGASGPTGELFDHGLDSWSTVPFTLSIFSVFGRGAYSVSPLSLLGILIAVQTVFIVTHWEKYNTGVLFLSWGYDASQYGLSLFFLFTFFVGHRFYHFHLFNGALNFAQVIMLGFYVTCLLSFAMSIYNIYHSYFVERTGKQNSLGECLRPLFSPILLFAVALAWGALSPTDVLGADPRTFFWAMGVVFSNTACHLIVAQMSSTRAQALNKQLLCFALVAGLAVAGVFGKRELFALKVFSWLATLVHCYYGICLVRQLCDHFHIYAFSLAYLEERKRRRPQLDEAAEAYGILAAKNNNNNSNGSGEESSSDSLKTK